MITLEPRLNFAAEARTDVVIKEEDPFLCISCDQPFASKSSIERTIERLAQHSMFADDSAALDRLRMCTNCRVVSAFDEAKL